MSAGRPAGNSGTELASCFIGSIRHSDDGRCAPAFTGVLKDGDDGCAFTRLHNICTGLDMAATNHPFSRRRRGKAATPVTSTRNAMSRRSCALDVRWSWVTAYKSAVCPLRGNERRLLLLLET